tara:strand:+ start:1313 stop:2032 length:720 start_codon:yes stop_codon:yes gene_type:complete
MNERLKFFLAGFFIGIAELLPGISGSTVAVAFGIYNKIIKILSNIRIKNISGNFSDISSIFRLDLLFLLVSSMLVTVILFSKIVLFFYTNYNDLFEIFLALIMIVISLFIIKDFISIIKKVFLFIVIGILFGYAINQIPDFEMSSNVLFLILIGFIAFSFFIVPGISGSAILVTFGQYRLIIQAVAELNFLTLVPFGLGCLLSLYLMPKLIANLVDKYNEYLMSFFSGLIFIAGLNLFF